MAGYWSGDHRSRRGDEDVQHCYSHSWRIALLERFWQARHPPRYAAYLTPSSPRFRLSSKSNHLPATKRLFDASVAKILSRATVSERSRRSGHLPLTKNGDSRDIP